MTTNKHGFKPKQEFTLGGIAWTVIETGADWVRCIASDCVTERAFDEDNRNDFAASSLRDYLNGEFLHGLIAKGVPEGLFSYFDIDLTAANDGSQNYGSDHVRIGLLTCEECRLLLDNIPALPNKQWWTATPSRPQNRSVRYADSDGAWFSIAASRGSVGVRPVCVLRSEGLRGYLKGAERKADSTYEGD